MEKIVSTIEQIKSLKGDITNIRFSKTFRLTSGLLSRDLTFKNCEFECIEAIDCEITHGLIFENCKMGKFVISNAVFTNQLCIFSDLTELDINGENNFKKLLIQKGGRFDKFPVISTLKLRGNLSGFLHFSFSSIDYLEFRALSCGADLHMQTGTCERLFFEYFVVNDKGSFKLHDLKSKAKDSVAKFLFCTFDKTIFRNCNFDSYTTFQICASPLDDIVCHGVHWNFKAFSTSKREKASYYSAVSKLYENNGNVSRSAQFKAKYFNESLKLPWKNRKLDNTTLFVSKLISNHCTNWLLVIFWIITINAFIFTVLDIGLLGIQVNFNASDWSMLLNPLHLTKNYSFYDEIINSNTFAVIDGFSRVINTTFYYHLAKSIRKFI